jgi:hypothetical protein
MLAAIVVGMSTIASASKADGHSMDSAAWTIMASASPATPGGLRHDSLSAAACPSAGPCVAVGTDGGSTLFEVQGRSKWTVSSGQSPGTPVFDEVTGVSCARSGSCLAIGETHANGQTDAGWVEQSVNGSWGSIPSPLPQNPGLVLTGVACPPSTRTHPLECLAVGSNGLVGSSGVIEQWNGKSWTSLTGASGTEGGALSGIWCFSITSCVGVGYTQGLLTLTEDWNGADWVAVPSPSQTDTQYNELRAVSCTSSTFCVAIGQYGPRDKDSEGLIEEWNGTVWTLDSAAGVGGDYFSGLTSVACASAHSCEATGFQEYLPGVESPLIERLHGSNWSLGSDPVLPKRAVSTSINSVMTRRSGGYVIVGGSADHAGAQSTLVEQRRSL